MFRSAASKVMWVGRATVFLVGLAVILALLFGAATTAVAHSGVDTKLFHLGHSNVATAITSLGGTLGVNGPMLSITNNNADANDTALSLNVQAGEAPMRVNRDTKVANLNADKVDGKDSAGFLPSETYLAEQSRTQAANSRSATVVSCDDGDLAISGGFRSVDPASHVWSSAHEIGDNAWVVDVLTGSTSDSYTAQAVCADFAPLHHEIEPL